MNFAESNKHIYREIQNKIYINEKQRGKVEREH